jgi:hypothetical protein
LQQARRTPDNVTGRARAGKPAQGPWGMLRRSYLAGVGLAGWALRRHTPRRSLSIQIHQECRSIGAARSRRRDHTLMLLITNVTNVGVTHVALDNAILLTTRILRNISYMLRMPCMLRRLHTSRMGKKQYFTCHAWRRPAISAAAPRGAMLAPRGPHPLRSDTLGDAIPPQRCLG